MDFRKYCRERKYDCEEARRDSQKIGLAVAFPALKEMKIFRQFIKINFGLMLLLFCWTNIFPQSNSPFSINTAPIENTGQPINDFANVIDDATEQQLNQKIKEFKARTNPQVVLSVATVKTTGDRDIFDYSLALARGWKIGSKADDNPSALLLVAIDDRKYQTQVSRDLEDELPDGLAGQLQRQYLVPAFKQSNYSKGISDTIDAYIKTIDARRSGVDVPPNGQTEPVTQKKSSAPSLSNLFFCLIILIVLMIIIFSRSGGGGSGGGRNNRWGGGGFGGGGGALPWIIGSIIANSGNSSGSSSSWGGGGSSSGGGSDWGGFGGGGDFGGGGAGGDW